MNSIINIICCAIPIARIRRRYRKILKNRVNTPSKLIRHASMRPIILWVDHALGGGTEAYSRRQFRELKKEYNILRLQYFPATRQYHLTLITNTCRTYRTPDIYRIYNICNNLDIDKIIVNNLVAYKNTIEILHIIQAIKENNTMQPAVSFRGHDYHCICPSFNLINCDGQYCNLRYNGGCEKCWANNMLGADATTYNVLKSGATTICRWRTEWGNFLEKTSDSIVLFSEKIADIFVRTYPQIKNKIQIIPHTVQKFKPIKIKPHREINIAILGAISYQKGAKIIHDMAQHLPQDINLKIIGTIKNAPSNIFVNGKYKTHQLPRLVKRHKIDLVFIPSIWPETFSYTTSEAISMGLPVACYNIGAPAERVSKYTNGLVLNNISPKENLIEIINFIKQQRQKK